MKELWLIRHKPNISAEVVQEAIKSLTLDKRDGDLGIYSNLFIYALPIMHILLSILFSSMLSHGHNPEEMLKAVLVSIPKDLKQLISSSDNYRGIALCSILCKIFDLIIIIQNSNKLNTSDLQFAFKPNHSTIMCTNILKETILYYNTKSSTVYTCLLDTSKAFDRISYTRLFYILLKRNIPAIIIKCMLDLYTRQSVQAEWQGSLSQTFSATNGTRQGAIYLPFCLIYTLMKF